MIVIVVDEQHRLRGWHHHDLTMANKPCLFLFQKNTDGVLVLRHEAPEKPQPNIPPFSWHGIEPLARWVRALLQGINYLQNVTYFPSVPRFVVGLLHSNFYTVLVFTR